MAVTLDEPLHFEPGQTIHVIQGPFRDFRGIIEKVYSEREKLRVVISFFGRNTPVELDLSQVEKA